jgi:DinB superfamily
LAQDHAEAEPMTTDPAREQLLALLDGRGAHMPFEAAVADFPDTAINALPPNVPYTAWHLVEHLRRTQRDMIEYVTDPDYAPKSWPGDYWPSRGAQASRAAWDASVGAFLDDRAELRALAADPERDLHASIPWTPDHSLFRCVRIIADHNAYHVGELAILRQVMGTWPADHR